MIFNTKNLKIEVDFTKRAITSLCICGKERLFGECPLFTVFLRDKEGKPSVLTAFDAGRVTEEADGAIFEGFADPKLSVRLSLIENNDDAEWRISVTPGDDSRYIPYRLRQASYTPRQP